jgi:hypothetical protein
MAKRSPRRDAAVACWWALRVAVAGVLLTGAAVAQVTGLYYREVMKGDRIYVFNTMERYRAFLATGEMGTAITQSGRGPSGETIVAENETAIDLYLFKHNLPAYDRPAAKPAAPPAAFPKTAIGGRVFADVTSKDNKDEGTGVKSSDSGVGIDVKRFYFTVTHDFNPTWSALFQSDIGDAGAKRYDIFVKKTYVQAKLSNEAIFRLGAADTPWVPFVEGLYGQRYIENTFIDALSFGTSAEWGVHFLGKAADNTLGYAVTIGNGKGYSSPSRSKSVDFEGRASFEPIKGLTLGIGGYSGKRGLDTDAAPAKHTATRFDAAVNWAVGPVNVGGEYFTADDWNRVTSTSEDSSAGFSGWLQFAATPEVKLFGRYDSADPSKDLSPQLKFTYYNAGIQWKPIKPLTTALAYKCTEVKNGTLSTSNGTIGSTNAGDKGTYNEFGLWMQFDF